MTAFPETLDEGCGGGMSEKVRVFLDGLVVMSSQVYMNKKKYITHMN